MNGEDDTDRELYIRLLIGILPFDPKIIIDILSDLMGEAERTSWPQLFRRGTNVGLFIGTIAFIGLLILLATNMNLSDIPLQDFGLIYVFAGALVVLMFLMKFLLKLLQNVNKAESLLTQETESLWAGLSEFTLGTLMVGTLWLFFAKVGSQELYLITIIGMGVVGMSIAGLSLTLSGAVNVINYSTTDSENAKMDEFEKEEEKPEMEH